MTATPRELAQLVAATYAGTLRADLKSIGWTVYSVPYQNTKTGYYGVSYKNTNTNEFAIVHKGSDFTSYGVPEANDYSSVLQIADGKIPAQYYDAVSNTDFVMANMANSSNKPTMLYLLGHSLGAALAEMNGAELTLTQIIRGNTIPYPFKIVTFDTIGSMPQAKIILSDAFRQMPPLGNCLSQDKFVIDATSYNNPTLAITGSFLINAVLGASPNIKSFNNINPHIGNKFEIMPCENWYKYCFSNFQVHQIGNMIQSGFDKGNGLPWIHGSDSISASSNLLFSNKCMSGNQVIDQVIEISSPDIIGSLQLHATDIANYY